MNDIADRPTPDLRQVRRILVIKLRAIGDVLLSTVVIPNLRSAFPGAHIDFLTESPARSIVEGIPLLDGTLIFRPKKDNIVRFFLTLRRRRYDLVFDLFCNPRSAQMCFATGAPVRVGYPFRGRAWAYTTHVRQRREEAHNTEFNLDALRHVGIPIVERRVIMPVDQEARAWADHVIADFAPGTRRLVAFNASGTWSTKRWPLLSFARLADLLAVEDHVLPLLVWGPGEEDDVRRIRDAMKEHAVIAPASSLTQLAALLERCDAMISNDAGPMHIGAAMDIPVLGIFGPTNPNLQGPFNPRSSWVRLETLDCLACNLTSCPIGNVCMSQLDITLVAEAYRAMIARADAAHK